MKTVHPRVLIALALAATAASAAPAYAAAAAADLLQSYVSRSGAAPQPARGQSFFNSRQGRDWSCATCHGVVPTQAGRHASTGKPITALAPAYSPKRFTDAARTEKWFRRNCSEVVGRECTAAEKADVLAWLMTLKPGTRP